MKKVEGVGREIAINDLMVFLQKHKKKEIRRGEITSESIEDDYIDVIEAIEDGLLVFEKGSPVYTLREPVKSDEGAVVISKVIFRSRIHPVDKTNVLNGINVSTEQGKYLLKMLSLATKLQVAELGKLEKDDYEVLNQITSVF